MYYQESSVILPKISKTIWVANSNFVIEFYEEEIDKNWNTIFPRKEQVFSYLHMHTGHFFTRK